MKWLDVFFYIKLRLEEKSCTREIQYSFNEKQSNLDRQNVLIVSRVGDVNIDGQVVALNND